MAIDFYRGLMVKVCEFKKNTPTTKGAGQADSYSTLLTCRGYLKKGAGARVLNNGEIYFDDAFMLITDFIQELSDNLKANLKVSIDGVLYTVNAWEKIDQKRFYLKFNLSVSE